MDSEFEYIVKITVIGDPSIGKSSLCSYYIYGNIMEQIYAPTIGIEFFTKRLKIKDKNIKLEIWDTAGQERFKSITKQYYRNSSGIFLCFSLNNPSSFYHLNDHIMEIKKELEDPNIILIGTFCDLPKLISQKDIQKFIDENKFEYFEVSSKTGANINNAFNALINNVNDLIDCNMLDCKLHVISNEKPVQNCCWT